ncbi:glycosyltransferase [Pseudokineococcus sp. 1T1Z-3]|uniref:glycosyltransferase n=1 Tax=Pseudokineococcus sp. 1T1Z-3 TaxID=3132745 RepID=UPI0030A4FA76
MVEAGVRRRPAVATFHSGRGDPVWDAVVGVVPRSGGCLGRWLLDFARATHGREVVLVRGTSSWEDRYRDYLGMVLLRVTRSRARVVVSDATLDVGSAAVGRRLPARLRPLVPWASRLLVRLADSPRTTWCVLSSEEVETFADRWRLRAGARGRTVLTRFFHTVDVAAWAPRTTDGGYLFSGGDSLRDYEALAHAVDGLDVPVRVATRRPVPAFPPTVEAGPTDHATFVALLAGCTALVLPLVAAPRSTGQQTYLSAMALGKPVVVTDAPGVRDLVEDGVTGLVADRGADGLRRAVDRLLAMSPQERARMGAAARAATLVPRSPEAYRARLLEVAGLGPGRA